MDSDVKRVLGLKLPTDPVWAKLAEGQIEEILTDHAWCEQKAASSCISIIILYPEEVEIVEKLSPIVTEEWGHFRMVLHELKKRGLKLGRPRKDEYVNQLLKVLRKGVAREELLLDKLLMCAMIEARSCERFRLLSKKVDDEALRKFYHDLMVSEAGHYRLFLDLAKTKMPAEKVHKRWQEFLDAEKEIMKELEVRGDRMH